MDIHLDDRLLHGRILHGWGVPLSVRRYVLVSRRLDDPVLRKLYRAGAEDAGCEVCFVQPGKAADGPPLPAAGDFWLTDSPEAVLALLEQGLVCERLLLIGLRDPDGELLGEDLRAGSASLAALRALQRKGVTVAIRRFPDEPDSPLFADEGRGD